MPGKKKKEINIFKAFWKLALLWKREVKSLIQQGVLMYAFILSMWVVPLIYTQEFCWILSLACASTTQLHTCFAFGVCSPVTFMRKLTCLAGSRLRESLQEMDSIAARPGLEEKMSQIDVSVPLITSLSTVLLCSTVCSFGINHSSERVSQENNPNFYSTFWPLQFCPLPDMEKKRCSQSFRVWKKRIL